MFDACAAPFLAARAEGVLVSRNLHIMGMGEAEVEQVLRPLMESSVNPTLAPYCQAGEVRLRITARAADRAEASALCDGLEKAIRSSSVGACIYGTDIPDVETGLVRVLRERGLTVSCAESCTGGMIGERITAVPGASAVFAGGCITYTNQVKQNLLGVDPAVIATHTEVSAEVAAAMACGVRARLDTDIALSATGYAGPGGGTAENPVGTVYIGLATRTGVQTFRLSWTANKTRGFIREASASFALREALMLAQQAAGRMGVNVDFTGALENAMLADDRYWKSYYSGTEREVAYKRLFSFSDRCRYYLPDPGVEQAVQTLLTQCGDLPPALLSLYFPRQYTKYRNGQLGSDLRAVILDRIGDVLDDYAAACFPALYE